VYRSGSVKTLEWALAICRVGVQEVRWDKGSAEREEGHTLFGVGKKIRMSYFGVDGKMILRWMSVGGRMQGIMLCIGLLRTWKNFRVA
jgi:hypothetical protein